MSEASATSRSAAARDLTTFQQAILAILAEGPRYGLAIKGELEAYYGEEVNHGRLYPNLDTLVEVGLVEKSERDKRTNEYALTQEGSAALLDLLAWTIDRYVVDADRAATVRDLADEALAD